MNNRQRWTQICKGTIYTRRFWVTEAEAIKIFKMLNNVISIQTNQLKI